MYQFYHHSLKKKFNSIIIHTLQIVQYYNILCKRLTALISQSTILIYVLRGLGL